MNPNSIESDSEGNEPAIYGTPAGLLRRLAAMFYDGLLLLAVLLVSVALLLILFQGSFTYHNPYFRTLVFLLCFVFYAWFWMHGQTLGMKTWKLRIQQRNGRPITAWQALLRFMLAIPGIGLAGLGLFWMLFDRERLTLYDRLSGSIIVQAAARPD